VLPAVPLTTWHERLGAERERVRSRSAPGTTRPGKGWFRAARKCAIIGALVVVFMFTLRSSFGIYRVASASMEPTLHCAGGPYCRRLKDDVVVVSRMIYRVRPVRRGDIVAFRMPKGVPASCRGGGVRLKRVIGLPGDVLTLGRSGDVVRRQRVPSDRYFLLSDNRRGSCDSREVGAIPGENLVGKVILIYSPPSGLRRP